MKQLFDENRSPKLNRKQLFGFDFSHPPLPEQRRIVAEPDTLLPALLYLAFKGEL